MKGLKRDLENKSTINTSTIQTISMNEAFYYSVYNSFSSIDKNEVNII